MKKGILKKKILSMLLMVAMLVTLAPVSAKQVFAAVITNPTYANWSYIYFGSYPQTEVTSSVTTAIRTASYDKNGDAWVNGVKYRRIAQKDTAYKNDDTWKTDYRYFKWERIKWRVLSIDGDSLFIVADSALDCGVYNTIYTDVPWKDSTIRTWLNGTFYNTAFDESEQKAITKTFGINGSYSGYNDMVESDVTDYIYLLSLDELWTMKYGFVNSSSTGIGGDLNKSNYADVRAGEFYLPFFWLRTRAYQAEEKYFQEEGQWYPMAMEILMEDYVYSGVDSAIHIVSKGSWDYIQDLDFEPNLILPAMHISYSSDQWYTNDDGTSGTGGGDGVQELSIRTAPQSQTVKEGTAVTFKVEASGGHSSDYTYQWYYDTSASGTGTQISGATGSSYTIPANSVTTSINGRYYYCVVNDGYGSATSSRAKLTVEKIDTIKITGDLTNQTVKSGDNVIFSVTASGGTPSARTCKWYYSTTATGTGTEIQGGVVTASGTEPTTYSRVLRSVNTSNAGYYYCVISDGQYTATSSRVKLTVQAGQTQDTTELSVPNLTVKLTAVNAVKLSWNKVNGATGYYVYRRIKGEKNYKLLKTVTGTSYDDKKLKKGKTYEYIVDAYNASTRTNSTAAVSKKIIGKLSKPKQKQIVLNSSKKKFTISWKTLKNAEKMEIWRSYNGGKYKKWKTVAAKKGKVTYSFANFKKGTYRFKLRAFYKADGKKFYSGYSSQEYGIRRN